MSKYDAYWLNDKMGIGHVIRVNPDGTIEDAHGVYAPESVLETDHDGQVRAGDEERWTERIKSAGWEPERGWTGQHGYAGPVMHPSEFVGGELADHIAATPGLWVAVAVECLPDRDIPADEADDHDRENCEACRDADHDCGVEPAGWAVLYRES